MGHFLYVCAVLDRKEHLITENIENCMEKKITVNTTGDILASLRHICARVYEDVFMHFNIQMSKNNIKECIGS